MIEFGNFWDIILKQCGHFHDFKYTLKALMQTHAKFVFFSVILTEMHYFKKIKPMIIK